MVNIGQKVSAGDILFEIDSPEVAEAKADFLKKMAVLKLARKTAERESNLFAKKISAEVEMQEANNGKPKLRLSWLIHAHGLRGQGFPAKRLSFWETLQRIM